MIETRSAAQTPGPRLVRRPPTTSRHRTNWRRRLTIGSALLIFALLGLGELARLLAPRANTSLTRFDAIIVLGYPADSDGNPTPVQLARVTEGVHEYERGVAPRLILTGGAAHNQFTEARVMARTAEAQGIPAEAIVVEPESKDTMQNGCNAARIMRAHGWRSAEVVSSSYHLPRAGLIFNQLPLLWRSHVAPPLEPEPSGYLWAAPTVEAAKTARYLIWARWREGCALPPE
ncbi:MAG: YdcF family protein [Terracidiphilus sp.]